MRFGAGRPGYGLRAPNLKGAREMTLFLILALIVAFAIAGGLVVSKFLFLLLLVALVVAALGLLSGGAA